MDSQKELLGALRSSYNQNERAPLPTASAHGLQHSLAEDATPSPGYGENAIQPGGLRPGRTSWQHSSNPHTPESPFEQRLNVLETSSATSAVSGNPALRWFGLLAHDAGRDAIQTAELEAEHSNIAPDDENYTHATPLQTATRIVDDPNNAVENESPRVSFGGDIGLPTSSERQLWQAKNAIQLLPSEKVIFENFVRHISLWVNNLP